MDTLAEMISLEKSLTQAIREFESKTGYCIDRLAIEINMDNDPHPNDNIYSPDVKSVRAFLVFADAPVGCPIRMATR